jgi:hypothetical protein
LIHLHKLKSSTVDLTSSTAVIYKENRTMHFRRTLKILYRLGLAVITAVTIAISAPAPSLATPPTQIITSIGSRRPLAVFEKSRETYVIECPSLLRRWDTSPRKSVDPIEYAQILRGSANPVVAKLVCNGFDRGYSSPAIPGKHMLIIKHLDGQQYRHYVTADFFDTFQVTPKRLSQEAGELILKQFPLISNTEFKSGEPAILLPPDCASCGDKPLVPKLPDCTKENCDPKPVTPIRPSALFSVPDRIVTAPHYPAMATFIVEDELYIFDPIGCPSIGALWKGIRSEAISRDEYTKLLQSPKFVGGFTCNVPAGFNQGYTSPEIPGGNLLILQHRDGRRYRHYANSPAFFTPLSIAPKPVSSSELKQILKDIPAGKTNFTTKN